MWSLPLPPPPRALALACTLLFPGLASFSQTADDPGLRPAEESRLLARLASEGTNSVTLFALADYLHDRGVDGDKAAVLRAESRLRQLLDRDPTNAPALALLGSVFTLKGRDAFWPTTQLRLVREGNDMMDQAVRLAPEDIQTRIFRALNNAHMPDFLGRTETVRTDLAWLWRRIEDDPSRFTVSDRQNLALHWGRQLKRLRRADDARKVWERGRDFDPKSPAAAELRTELEKLH